jgi:hypothetical protein
MYKASDMRNNTETTILLIINNMIHKAVAKGDFDVQLEMKLWTKQSVDALDALGYKVKDENTNYFKVCW